MKENVTFSDFCDRFRDYDRNDNFSYQGKRALFDWLEELEQDTGTEQQLDIIALCCDFSEYDSLEEFQEDYGAEYESLEDVEEQTIVIPVGKTEGFIIQTF